MRRPFLLFLAFILAMCPCAALDLSRGWQFSLDGAEPVSVDLPHDWAFQCGYDATYAQGEKGGYACGGRGYYAKSFTLGAKDLRNKVLYLDFDGVYMNSTVRVNGIEAGTRAYGYISFSYDVTDKLKKGRNLIEVEVDNSLEPSARWYHGCGIYGGVRLRSENPLHFVEDGLFVKTQNISGKVEVSFETSGEYGRVEAVISKGGTLLASAESRTGTFAMYLDAPQQWSPENPVLYDFEARLYDARGRCTDTKQLKIGFKTVGWDPVKGLLLNGSQYKIHGVCEHFEGGPVGAAWTPGLMLWKLRLLKSMGCNSVRTAHNPALPFFYDICDEIGLLVMDEAFDGWMKKAPEDYGKQSFERDWQKDLTAFLRRDRNHACVFVYSMGNETKGDVAALLVETCHDIDPTRAVTSGSSAQDRMDVLGMNGGSEKQRYINSYEPGKQAFIGTETPHTWQVRGFYRTQTWYRDGFPNEGQDPFEIPDLTDREIFGYDWTAPENRVSPKQVFNSSYDNATVRMTARHSIVAIRDLDWYSGSYRWTGFDYPGEAGYVHGGWPFRAFQGGALDLAGFPKDLFFLYQSEWNPSVDMVHLLPSWTHPDMPYGTLIPVWAYTTGDEVELFQDGRSLGRVRKGTEWDRIQCSWMVPWKPGRLEAVAYREGREIAREVLRSAGEPSDFVMSSERVDEHLIVTFTATDSEGTVCPYADSRVYIVPPEGSSVTSFESGSPVDGETCAGALSRRLFFGLARAFVRTGSQEVAAGAILCDRSLKTSDKAFVVLKGLEGCEVLCSTDGTEPSVPYRGPLTVTRGMVIKVKVMKGGHALLSMEERMEGGLYWGRPGAPAFVGKIMEFGPDGSLSWYQENDGAARDAVVRISYQAAEEVLAEVWNNGRKVARVRLPGTRNAPELVTEKISLSSGANDLQLKLVSGPIPEIKQIDVL